ncbi:hypothetical protein IV203_032335 [Nitzschia inconspicua]|uniref:Uncharacterized protein n=1 Tax=Nitzschia inconspicua TaxID=303405 RepID=A0A9K3PH66_9STRA|nr:hypothetical protein IV203_032335 [Nitzschia inconspicua]
MILSARSFPIIAFAISLLLSKLNAQMEAMPLEATSSAYSVICENDGDNCYGVCKLNKGQDRDKFCHCIPENQKKCPPSPPIPGSYEPAFIDQLRSQVALNPFQLNCNPFFNPLCQTSPPQTFTGQQGEVCGLLYDPPNEGQECSQTYSMKTYKHINKARQDGAVVTHAGACGVCSTTQDLAAFMINPNPEQKVVQCVLSVLSNPSVIPTPEQLFAMLSCYMRETGFSQPCSLLWLFNGFATFQLCYQQCANAITPPLPPPNDAQCQLNECLQCDTELILPTYAKFSGRRRGQSGILTATVRSCSELANIEHGVCSSVVIGLQANGLRG